MRIFDRVIGYSYFFGWREFSSNKDFGGRSKEFAPRFSVFLEELFAEDGGLFALCVFCIRFSGLRVLSSLNVALLCDTVAQWLALEIL